MSILRQAYLRQLIRETEQGPLAGVRHEGRYSSIDWNAVEKQRDLLQRLKKEEERVRNTTFEEDRAQSLVPE